MWVKRNVSCGTPSRVLQIGSLSRQDKTTRHQSQERPNHHMHTMGRNTCKVWGGVGEQDALVFHLAERGIETATKQHQSTWGQRTHHKRRMWYWWRSFNKIQRTCWRRINIWTTLRVLYRLHQCFYIRKSKPTQNSRMTTSTKSSSTAGVCGWPIQQLAFQKPRSKETINSKKVRKLDKHS
jgi:hypothetical protein